MCMEIHKFNFPSYFLNEVYFFSSLLGGLPFVNGHAPSTSNVENSE